MNEEPGMTETLVFQQATNNEEVDAVLCLQFWELSSWSVCISKKNVQNRTVSKYLILVSGISDLLLAVLKLYVASKFEQISEYV